MRKVKVEDLIGEELDWAVALFQGAVLRDDYGTPKLVFPGSIGLMDFRKSKRWITTPDYSTDWSKGMPIIQSRGVSIKENLPAMKDSVWTAWPSITAKGCKPARPCSGPTMLIAGLRCVVSSMFEDYVEIPE